MIFTAHFPVKGGHQVREALRERRGSTAGFTPQPSRQGDAISSAVGAGGLPPELIRSTAERRPGIDPATVAAGSWAAARELLEGYIEAGLSKFVIRPAGPGIPVSQFIDDFRAELLPLEN